MLCCFEQSETWSQWIWQNGKEVFKALPSQIKRLLTETIIDFLLAYMEKEKHSEDFIQNAL